METISNTTCTKCQHCGEWTNYADDEHHKARVAALAESEARAEGLRKSLAEMIELRQATQDGRVTERHELDIVRDAKAAIAQEAGREAASA